LTNSIALVAWITSLVAFELVARTGYLGGEIRHTEINAHSLLQGEQVNSGIEED